MNFKRIALLLAIVLCIVYLLGPQPKAFSASDALAELQVPQGHLAVEKWLTEREKALPVKPDCAARILWAKPGSPARTPYVLLYLPGFTATEAEGAPVHTKLAARFGCNLLLARLSEHGLTHSEPLLNLTAQGYWQSAIEALRLAEQLGDSIILISTSTGGTLASMLCAAPATRSRIAANIMYSPNIAINDPAAWVLNNPWGLQIARAVMGGNYIMSKDQRPQFKRYWYSRYRIEGAVAVQELIEAEMKTDNFSKIDKPTLLLYYYKNEEAQDPVVKVNAMLDMYDALATPAEKKHKVAVAGAGDHVLANPLKSKAVEEVYQHTEQFLKAHFFKN